MWTKIRLLLVKQSDLGPHCLQKCLLKSQADDKADGKVVVIGSIKTSMLKDRTSFLSEWCSY